jgi:DNA-binding transcriptional LysR family regulator
MGALSGVRVDKKSETFDARRSMKSDTTDLEHLNPAKLDLNKLVTFLLIAETGGVSAAARRLALTRSAVSHSLGALESALGVTLFHRVGKSLVLTPEGAKLRGAVEAARDRIGGALDELIGGTQEVRGAVRIGLFLGFSRFRLAAVVDDFLRSHAAARVRVSFGPQAWLVDELLAGRLDLTLSLRPLGERMPHVRSRRLFAQSLVLAAHQPVPRKPVGFDAVGALAFVDYYQSDPLIDRWTRHHFGARRVVARDRIRAWAASTDLALELALRGVGAAVLPEDVALPFQRRGELAILRGPKEPLRDSIWLNELRSGRRAQAPDAFRARLVQELAEVRES